MNFANYWWQFPSTITEVTVGVVFLLKLLDWRSLLSGLLIFVVAIPLNWIASKAYAKAQDNLMGIRDNKLVLITETLHGIRQIKFSAQENRWQQRIGKIRIKELMMQWRVFWLDSCIISFWIIMPVMLGAVSLTVHAYLHGILSASVAFTSVSVFSQLELSMAVVPELISDAIEAFVSARRIEEYLNAPENETITTPGAYISFEDATLSWPTDDFDGGKDDFMLQNLSLSFPPKELSIISGATGSGKSLLLSALIGEADIMSGTVRFPEPPSHGEIYDPRANRSNWILDSAVAYVAQIPWIENATIKDNVLFGFPYNPTRYKKVLNCCALVKDLESLPDGDQTDIGANGINLSGGQRWRVSFARALYSRAGILILDDIFR